MSLKRRIVTPLSSDAGRGGEPAPSRRQAAAVGALLFLLAGLVFGGTVFNDFVNFDDYDYVSENPRVSRGLTATGIWWAFSGRHSNNWHPLTWLSHMLDCQIFALNAGGHHATSVLLHATSAALLFLALRRMTGRLWTGAFAAALFAVHPLRVESVAWVAERKDVLSGLFFMLMLLAYLGHARRPASLARSLAVVALFAAGLLSKPMVVTAPLLLLVLDFWPLGRLKTFAGLVPLIREKIPLLVLAAASSALTIWAQRDALLPVERLTFAWRLGNALVAYVAYAGKSLFPTDLAVFYPHPGMTLAPVKIAAATSVLLGVTGMAVAARRRHPHLVAGWLWFVGMLVPVIGIVQVGEQAMADRYAYLPQIGLCLSVAWTAAAAGRLTAVRRWVCGAAVASVALLVGVTWRQTGHWRDSETLFLHALATTSGNHVAHNNIGIVRTKAGRNDEAIAHFRQALAIKPLYLDALTNLGVTLAASGSIDEAIVAYRQALATDPDFADARYNLGVALFQRGEIEQAIAEYRKVLATNPDYADARFNLGAALARRGATEEAIAQYRTALALRPDSAGTLTGLGDALVQRGAIDEAIAHYRSALALNPGYVFARINLGVALVQRGAIDEAIAQYRTAIEFKPDSVEAHFNLSGLLAERGRVEEAAAHRRRALDLAARQGSAPARP